MSTMDTTALARIMLGGFNQGAGMVSNAAQIMDARQRAAQQQAQYEAEVAYRQQQQRQQEAKQLAQMSSLANFAEARGLLTQGPDPMAYGPFPGPQAGPSPVGPFQPGMEPAVQSAGQFGQMGMGGPTLGLDRATLMGMDPRLAGGLIEDMLGQRRAMENAQFEADLSDQIRRREAISRAGRIAAIRSQMRGEGFSEQQIGRALTAANLSEVGVPAGVVSGMFGEQPYQRTAEDYRTLLGMPGPAPSGAYGPFQPGAEPAVGQDRADVMARWQMSPSDAARFAPDAAIAPPTLPEQVSRYGQDLGPRMHVFSMLKADGMAPSDAAKVAGLGVDNMENLRAAASMQRQRVNDLRDAKSKIEKSISDANDIGDPSGLTPALSAQLRQLDAQLAQESADYDELSKIVGDMLLEGSGLERPKGTPAATQGTQGRGMPSMEEIRAIAPQVIEELRARLGRYPTREERAEALRQRFGGGG